MRLNQNETKYAIGHATIDETQTGFPESIEMPASGYAYITSIGPASGETVQEDLTNETFNIHDDDKTYAGIYIGEKYGLNIFIVNMVRHDCTIGDENGKTITFPMNSTPINAPEETITTEQIGGFTFRRKEFAPVKNLPTQYDNVFYIVSALIRSLHPERTDFISPNGVREESGKPITRWEGFA